MKKLLFYGLLVISVTSLWANITIKPQWDAIGGFLKLNGYVDMCSQFDIILRDAKNPDIKKPPYWQSTIDPEKQDSLTLKAFRVNEQGKLENRGQVTLIDHGKIVQDRVPVRYNAASEQYYDNTHYRIYCIKTSGTTENYVPCQDVIYYYDSGENVIPYCKSGGKYARDFDPLGLGLGWTPKK